MHYYATFSNSVVCYIAVTCIFDPTFGSNMDKPSHLGYIFQN